MYLSDNEIRQRLNIPEKKWRPVVTYFERQGFPRKDPLVGMRYWPAVENWLLQRYSGGLALRTPDLEETENWDAYHNRRARAQAQA